MSPRVIRRRIMAAVAVAPATSEEIARQIGVDPVVVSDVAVALLRRDRIRSSGKHRSGWIVWEPA